MRRFTLTAAVILLSVPCSAMLAQQPASVEVRTQQLNKLFKDYWEDSLRLSPENATYIGDKRYNDRWSDYSPSGFNKRLELERDYMLKLAAIDTTGLPDQVKLSSDLLMRSFEEDQEAARFKEWEMPIDQFKGVQVSLPQLASAITFADKKDYEDYLVRLNTIDTVFSQIMSDMELGMQDGRIPPKFLLEKVQDQIKALLALKPEDSPFAEMIKKFPASIPAADQKQLHDAILEAVKTHVYPSYQKLAKYMQYTYVPKGRTEPGIWSIPDGDAYYAFRIKQSTTLNKSADEIFQIGMAEVRRDEAEMLVIAKKLGYTDLKAFNEAIKKNPKLHATSRQQMIDTYKGYIDGMRPELPKLFGVLPKAPLEVLAVPEFMEKQQSAAYYMTGTPDFKRPGRMYVNTYNFADRGLEGAEAVAYHEGIPGHHLQLSIAQEVTGLPEFRKYRHYTAYTEGWGLYSERLGKEIGFYKDPYNDYGRLEADIWRAIRLVVDTGVHSKHWTRQQMVDFFHEHSSVDETNIQSEVDRYIAWPGQALGYKMGQLKLLELRDRAQKALGAKFDIRKFHDLIIDSGALPLDVLDQRVNEWIAAQK